MFLKSSVAPSKTTLLEEMSCWFRPSKKVVIPLKSNSSSYIFLNPISCRDKVVNSKATILLRVVRIL